MSELKTPWKDTGWPRFPKLNKSASFDVLVVGGGLTGLTAAYLLKKSGLRVGLVERNRLGHGDTGCTTAHLTCVTDLRLSALARNFGNESARLIWEGGASAINTIEAIARAEEIHCDFRRVPGYLHAPFHAGNGADDQEARDLKREARLANELEIAAAFDPAIPLMGRPGIRFPNQAKFEPMKYLAGLARAVAGDGSAIFEDSEAAEFDDQQLQVTVNGKVVEFGRVIIATHVPIVGRASLASATVLQTKLAPYSTYVVGAAIPQGAYDEASYWDTGDPYHYLRIDRRRGHDYAIFGGEDHKTGQAADLKQRIARLEELLLELIPEAKVDCHWSGQVIETNDGLPYIGETADKQFSATGFVGNGVTFGTLAAMLACDWALGRQNPWQELLSVSRKHLRGGTLDYLKENLSYPYYLVSDWLQGSEAQSTRQVKRGEGKIVTLNGQRAACSRNDQGKLTAVSAVCTHMGCLVHWNEAERTWDCPCHGSRFSPTGEVIAGPAEAPLEPVQTTPRKAKA